MLTVNFILVDKKSLLFYSISIRLQLIFVGLLQLPDIRKQFPDVFTGVLLLIVWKSGDDIVQPFSRIDFRALQLASNEQMTAVFSAAS